MKDRVIDLDGPLAGVVYEKRDGIARITLDRPERGNALTPAMHGLFHALWSDVREDPEVRVAIVAARGERHFCTGFDVAEAEADDADEVFGEGTLAESVLWSPYQNKVWKPVICVVNGLCVGGGHHFVVDADIVVASRNAAFMDSHVNVGMVGAIENIGLARRLPLGSALRMTLLGRHYRMSAERAHQLGLVDELADSPEAALALAETMAEQMRGNSPQAMARSKQAIWGALEHGYAEAMERGWALLQGHWSHPDFQEGPRAFGEGRDPVWNPDPQARIEDDS
jgi:enoyl-CoA hydratase/carnithine racemase